MSFRSELRILYHMLLSPIRGHSHAERLENFYQGQASGYDAFRSRLLHGRQDLWKALPTPEGGIWLDMGGGTGWNLTYIETALNRLGHVYIVDLSPSLLAMAQDRIDQSGWKNVTPVEADVTQFTPDHMPVDVVTFSYSLTMIPDWFAALDQAWHLLRPGGTIGVVDFYVSRKYPAEYANRHSWLTRSFWPVWFNADNVFPSPDHVPYLHRHFETDMFSEHTGTMPYMPGVHVPYYLYMGRKPVETKS